MKKKSNVTHSKVYNSPKIDIDLYYEHLKAAGRSPRTIQEYKWDLKFWNAIANKNGGVYSLKIAEIEKAIAKKEIMNYYQM